MSAFRTIVIVIIVLGFAVACGRKRRAEPTHAVGSESVSVQEPSTVLVEHATAVVAGLDFACALVDRRVLCWGAMPEFQQSNATARWVDGFEDIVQIGASQRTVCALTQSGDVWCAGERIGAALGAPIEELWARTPERIELRQRATELRVASGRACAFSPGSAVECWGYGIGSNRSDVSGREPTVVAARAQEVNLTHLAMFVRATVDSPLQVTQFIETAYGVIAVDAAERQALVSAREPYAACAVDAGRVACRGSLPDWLFPLDPAPRRDDYEDVAGITDARAVSVGTMHACVLTMDAHARCWGSNGLGSSHPAHTSNKAEIPQIVEGVDNAAEIAIGDGFTCVRTAEGRIACWGTNQYGQSGYVRDGQTPFGAPVTWVRASTLRDTPIVGQTLVLREANGGSLLSHSPACAAGMICAGEGSFVAADGVEFSVRISATGIRTNENALVAARKFVPNITDRRYGHHVDISLRRVPHTAVPVVASSAQASSALALYVFTPGHSVVELELGAPPQVSSVDHGLTYAEGLAQSLVLLNSGAPPQRSSEFRLPLCNGALAGALPASWEAVRLSGVHQLEYLLGAAGPNGWEETLTLGCVERICVSRRPTTPSEVAQLQVGNRTLEFSREAGEWVHADDCLRSHQQTWSIHTRDLEHSSLARLLADSRIK